MFGIQPWVRHRQASAMITVYVLNALSSRYYMASVFLAYLTFGSYLKHFHLLAATFGDSFMAIQSFFSSLQFVRATSSLQRAYFILMWRPDLRRRRRRRQHNHRLLLSPVNSEHQALAGSFELRGENPFKRQPVIAGIATSVEGKQTRQWRIPTKLRFRLEKNPSILSVYQLSTNSFPCQVISSSSLFCWTVQSTNDETREPYQFRKAQLWRDCTPLYGYIMMVR